MFWSLRYRSFRPTTITPILLISPSERLANNNNFIKLCYYRFGSRTVAHDGASTNWRTNQPQASLFRRRVFLHVISIHRTYCSRHQLFSRHYHQCLSHLGSQCTHRLQPNKCYLWRENLNFRTVTPLIHRQPKPTMLLSTHLKHLQRVTAVLPRPAKTSFTKPPPLTIQTAERVTILQKITQLLSLWSAVFNEKLRSTQKRRQRGLETIFNVSQKF